MRLALALLILLAVPSTAVAGLAETEVRKLEDGLRAAIAAYG